MTVQKENASGQTTMPTLDYARGERWIQGWDKDGNAAHAPHMIQRDDESLEQFIERVVSVEKAATDVR